MAIAMLLESIVEISFTERLAATSNAHFINGMTNRISSTTLLYYFTSQGVLLTQQLMHAGFSQKPIK